MIPPDKQDSELTSRLRALAAGQRIPAQKKSPYWKDIRLPGGVKHSEWNGFHDLVLIEEFHAKDFGCAMGLFAGRYWLPYHKHDFS